MAGVRCMTDAVNTGPKPLPAFVIARHGVPEAPGSGGLSPLQAALLDDPAPVRIAAAPTGAGKSHAFERAAVDYGARILFVVPTRRLAQNLATSIAEGLSGHGASNAEIARRLAVWTSDERRRQAAESPEVSVNRRRYREVYAMDLKPGEGQMIVATPESVAIALLAPLLRGHGADPVDLATVLGFDHVVFDEFHTIDARGFGLAAAVACIAAALGPERGAARVTFLSATPVDIAPALEAFEVPTGAIAHLEERIVTDLSPEREGGRVIHGDIAVGFERAASLADLLEAHADAAAACLAREDHGQVVIVLDSVRALFEAAPMVASWCDRLGVGPGNRLMINSVSDSADARTTRLFTEDRQADPSHFAVLLATSSVEMGVTFRAGMMVMDPGFGAASFVQRLGRVARGDVSGTVVVRLEPGREDREPWLRRLLSDLAGLSGRVTVEAFANAVLEPLRESFAHAPSVASEALLEKPVPYGAMPERATWCAAVFWAAMQRADHVYKGQRDTLRAFSTQKARHVLAELSMIERTGIRPARVWVAAFLREARTLRTMLPSVRVVDPDGCSREVRWSIYAGTPELTAAPAMEAPARFGVVFEVRVDRPVEAILGSGERQSYTHVVEAMQPHVGRTLMLDHRRLVSDYLAALRHDHGRAEDREEETAIEGALRLSALTGIVPTAGEMDAPRPANNTVL
mgnify:CR=1 FL=1